MKFKYIDNPEYPTYSPYEEIQVTTYADGQCITLKESASYNHCPTYSKYMLTSRN